MMEKFKKRINLIQDAALGGAVTTYLFRIAPPGVNPIYVPAALVAAYGAAEIAKKLYAMKHKEKLKKVI
jgi:hypothetical protein